MIGFVVGRLIRRFAQLVTGVRSLWLDQPDHSPCVYFSNHSSHADFILIWSALPFTLRHNTKPVAAKDYWEKGLVRRFLIKKVFDGLLIDREGKLEACPIEQMSATLKLGSSLIVFPEGTRNSLSDELLPFKSGIYRLAKKSPETRFVPVWVTNLNRVMPKGKYVPLPLLSTVVFGVSLWLEEGEDKEAFLIRCQSALAELNNKTNDF